MDDLLMQAFGGESAVRTEMLRKEFARTIALDGVTLSVPLGAVYLLVGPNGAGKTTLLRVLLDQLRPTSGGATVLGHNPHSAGAQVRAATGYVPETGVPPYPAMRVGELLQYHARYYAAWDSAYADRLGAALGIKLESHLGALSKGEGRRVQLVMALAHRPPLLLLDEPTDGLDPVIRDRFFSLLAEHLAERQTTVLVSSHLVYESELFANHLGVLGHGKLHAQIDRPTLDAKLRRYTGRIDSGTPLSGSLQSRLLQSRDFGSGTEWIIWGEEAEVRDQLGSAGAEVRDVRRLTLEETARLLMSRTEVSA